VVIQFGTQLCGPDAGKIQGNVQEDSRNERVLLLCERMAIEGYSLPCKNKCCRARCERSTVNCSVNVSCVTINANTTSQKEVSRDYQSPVISGNSLWGEKLSLDGCLVFEPTVAGSQPQELCDRRGREKIVSSADGLRDLRARGGQTRPISQPFTAY
jgi:hypothetical protein